MKINNISRQTVLLEAEMLMLRRHEKDFMLRRDIKYVDKFNQRIEVMRNKLANSEANNVVKKKTNIALDNYQQQFILLVQGEQKFGLTTNQGVLGVMRQIIHQKLKVFIYGERQLWGNC